MPIRVVAYEFRPDSSGAGKFRGGSGLVRSYQSLADGTTFTILADRGRHRPWGLAGGSPGRGTEVLLVKKRRVSAVPLKSTFGLDEGDIVELRTAGGGGFGLPGERERSKVAEDVEDGILTREPAETVYDLPLRRMLK